MTSFSHARLIPLDAETFRSKGFANRRDPLTLEPFKVGDRVRLCVKCDAAFLSDSWNSVGSVCGCFGDPGKVDLRGGRRGGRPAGAGAETGIALAVIVRIALLALLILAIAYFLLR